MLIDLLAIGSSGFNPQNSFLKPLNQHELSFFWGGQFAPVCPGQFAPELGGQFQPGKVVSLLRNRWSDYSVFSTHSSPVGLVFDRSRILPGKFKGAGFLLRYSSAGLESNLLSKFTSEGGDLLLLNLQFINAKKEYKLKTIRIASGFKNPSDCIIVGDSLYIVEYRHNNEGNLWRVQFR